MTSSPTARNEAGPRRYAVFISYRHADNREAGRQWGNWLHETLEGYVVPPELVGTPNLRGGVVPDSLYPVFRDEAELPADADLSNNIRLALERSDLLVVLCSPRAVQSRYVAEEIRYFKELGRSSRVLALMIDGEPNVTDDAGKSGLECLPEPLRYGAVREDGSVDWGVRVEPIAADVRPQGRPEQGWTSAALYGRELKKQQPGLSSRELREAVTEYDKRLNEAVLKIVAGGLGVPFGVLTQRDQVRALAAARRRSQVLTRLAAGFALLALAAAVAGVVAWQMRGKAQRSEQTVRQNASRSEFKTATSWMQKDQGNKALAHYAKALRLDPHNSSAAFCILTQLGQKSWPVLLREYPGQHSVRQMRLLPDGRLVTTRALDAYSVRGTATTQVLDWGSNRLLTLPEGDERRENEGLFISRDGSMAAVSRSHKGMESTRFVPLPPVGDRPLSLTAGVYAYADPPPHRFLAMRDDGKTGLVLDSQEKTLRIIPTDVDVWFAESARITDLTWPANREKYEGEPEGRPAGKTIPLPVSDADALVLAWFEGADPWLLLDSGRLLKVDLTAGTVSQNENWPGKRGRSILTGTRAEKSGRLALLYEDGVLTVNDGATGKEVAASPPINATGEWPVVVLEEVAKRKAARGSDPDSNRFPQPDYLNAMFAMRFCQDEQVVVLSRPLEDNEKTSFKDAWWPFADEALRAKPLKWQRSDEPMLRVKGMQSVGDPFVVFKDAVSGRRFCENFRHESAVTALDALNDHLFATGTMLGFARIWTRTDAPWPLVTQPPQTPAPLKPRAGNAPEGEGESDELFATAPDGKTKLWGRPDGSRRKPYLEVNGSKTALEFSSEGGMYGAQFSTDGRLVVLCVADGLPMSTRDTYNEGAALYDVQTGKTIRALLPHDGCKWAGLDHSGRWIITLGNGNIQCWEAATGERSGPYFDHPGVNWIANDPHHPTRLLGFTWGGALKIWDLEKSALLSEASWPTNANANAKVMEGAEELREAVFDPAGRWFIQREAEGMVFRDLESGELLTGVLPHPSVKKNLSYEELIRLLGWEVLLTQDLSPAAEALSAAAEAIAGLEVSDSGALEPVRDPAAAVQSVQGQMNKLKTAGQSGAAHDFLQMLFAQPQFKPLLETPAAILADHLAEGRAAIELQKAVQNAALRPWDMRFRELRWAVSPERMQALRDAFRNARRTAPAHADRLIGELRASWAKRTDALGLFTAIELGDRDSQLISRAEEMLIEYQKLLDGEKYSVFDEAFLDDMRYMKARHVELQRSTAEWRLPLPAGPYASVKTGVALATAEEEVQQILDKSMEKELPALDTATLKSWYAPLLKVIHQLPDRQASSRYRKGAPLLEWLARPEEKPTAEELMQRVSFAEDPSGNLPRLYSALLLLREGVHPHAPANGEAARRALKAQILTANQLMFATTAGWKDRAAVYDSVFPLITEFVKNGGDLPSLLSEGEEDKNRDRKLRDSILADARFPVEAMSAAQKVRHVIPIVLSGPDNQQERALKILQSAAGGDMESSAEYLAALGTAFFRLKKYAEAAPVLHKAVPLQPKAGRFDIAVMLERESDSWRQMDELHYAEAEAAARLAIASNPERHQGYRSLGKALEKLSRHDAAAVEFGHAVQKAAAARQTGDASAASRDMARVLGAGGRLPEAEKALEAAMALAPNNGDAARNCGWEAFNLKLFAKALGYWEASQKLIGEKDEDLMAGVAIGHWSTGNKAAATMTYQKLVALNKEYAKADFVARLNWTAAEKAAMAEILAALPQ